MYTGVIRIKFADIGKYTKDHVQEFDEIPDSMHVTSEGSDTINFYPQATAKLSDMQKGLAECALYAINNIGDYYEDVKSLLQILKNNLDDGLIDQSFSMQYRYQGAPFIDVGIVKKEA